MKLGCDSENVVLCDPRVKAIENIAYSGWKADGGFEEFEEEDS